MRVFSLILPAFVVLAMIIVSHNSDLWWAYLLMLGGSEGLMFLCHYLFKNNTAKEYVSGFVVCVEHYNEWVEEVKRTRYERDSNGNSREVTYYEYITHPEYWQECYNTGHSKLISEAYFYQMCQIFGTSIDFFHTYHPNCVQGGGGHRCNWNGKEWDTTTATFKQGYYNPILNSNSIFKYRDISADEAQKYELFEYPKIIGDEQNVVCYQPSIVSEYDRLAASPQQDIQILFQHVNAFLGKAKEIHVFVLVFDAQKYSAEVTEIQRSYWHGGNKNELTICIGVDNQSVKWCEAFSWMDDPSLHVEIRDYFLQNTEFDLIRFVHWLPNHLDKWKRREVAEFKYLGTNLPKESKIWLLVISLFLSVFCIFATLQWIGIPEKKSVAPVVEELVVEQPHEEHSREAFSSQADGTDTISSVTDYDGNTYPIVRIGNQVWMAENLRTTHGRDGSSIHLGHSSEFPEPPCMYYPDNNPSNVSRYGCLYNWKAATRVCPSGWHIPSGEEFQTLMDYCSVHYAAGGDSKNNAKALAATYGWESSTKSYVIGNDPSANNLSGFSALPAGYYNDISYRGFGWQANFWCSTVFSLSGADARNLYSYDSYVCRDFRNDSYGLSVRCVRD